MARHHCVLLGALLLAWGATNAVAAASRTFPPCRCVRFTTDCSSRQLSSVQEAGICPRATKIDLSNNDFREIPSGLSVNVTEIDLSRNRINGSNEALRGMSKLKVLNLKVNALSTLGCLPEHCVLRNLDVSVNDIVGVGSALQRCSQLETLDLSFNKITSLNQSGFSTLSRLRNLDLSGNTLGTLPEGAFDGLSQLDTLSLRSCQLTAVPEMAFRGAGALRRLHLQSNRLATLPRTVFAPLPQLPQLQQLGLGSNGLRQAPAGLFEPLARLEELHLERNALAHMPSEALRGLHKLKALWMQGSGLNSLPVLSDCCVELRIADFRDNNITRPSEEAMRALLEVTTLERADLRCNPLAADTLRWAREAADLRVEVDTRACGCARISRRQGESQPTASGYVHACESAAVCARGGGGCAVSDGGAA